jgi:MSHA biogenesis protein MshP
MKRQRGTSLVVALFVIVVVAMLAVFATTVGGTQQQIANVSVQTSRALAAARTGLEWATYRARVAGLCEANRVVALNEGALRGFQVTVRCVPAAPAFDITVTAQYGVFGTPEFASRSLTSRVFALPY